MLTKTRLALAAVLALGAASAAQANDNDRNDRGGYRYGPLGQDFKAGSPTYHWSMRRGGEAFGFVPGYNYRHHRTWRWDWDR
jgi:opacity protein-like surface antigen